jgi:hypothetical protein
MDARRSVSPPPSFSPKKYAMLPLKGYVPQAHVGKYSTKDTRMV